MLSKINQGEGKMSRGYEVKRWILMMVMVLGTFIFASGGTKSSASAKVITEEQVITKANEQVGKYFAKGKCLKYVADFWQSLGAVRNSSCCANNYGSSHIQSGDINNIPIGADVFFGNCGGGPCKSCGSACYGHIGIYIGNGYFLHATGGWVQKSTVSSWKKKYRGWGYHSNVTIQNMANQNNVNVPDSSSQKKYSIYNVKVKSCSRDQIVLEWKTENLPRSCMVVTAGDRAYRTEYAIGDSFSATFNRSQVNGCPRMVQIRIYAYSSTSGPGENETVHLVTYNAPVGYVSFPEREEQYWSDLVPVNMRSEGMFAGWVISDTSEIRSVNITINGKVYSASLIEREDVRKAYPDYRYVKGYMLPVYQSHVHKGSNRYEVKAVLANGSTYVIKSGIFQAE